MNPIDPIVGGIPLIILIFGMVEFAKQLGLKGNGSLVFSMALGVAFGVLFQLSLGVPTALAGWLVVVVYGLGLGLTTSGFYNWANKRFPELPASYDATHKPT